MKRRTKIRLAVGLAAALGIAGGGAAIAAGDAWSPRGESQAIIDDVAAELGVEPSALSEALENALENRVDEAVKDGRLTEEEGAELKERIRSGVTPPLFGGFGRGFDLGPRHFGPFGHFANLETARTYLGLTAAELRERLAKGDTLAEIARAEGKTVDGLVQALVEAAEKRIDEAVADGRLAETQANELKQGLEARITDLVNGELSIGGFGPALKFGPGLGLDLGPGHFWPFGHFASLETARTYLGLTRAELRERLANGDTLAKIARDEGKTADGLVKSLVDAAEKRIDEAVADGRLTETQANELKQGLEARITDLVTGELSGRGFGFRLDIDPGVGPGFGFERFRERPRLFDGPRA